MAGYANRVIVEDFPELSEPDDRVFVIIKNPKTQPISALEAEAVKIAPDGTPDTTETSKVVYKLLSRLVIGGKLYDSRVDAVDADGKPLDQPLLTFPLTEETAAGLPLEVISRITERIKQAQNPQ